MNFDEYDKFASVTFPKNSTSQKDRTHAAFGLSTEVGELVDALKKHEFYGTPLDIDNIREEIGDVLWYLSLMCRATGLSLDEAAHKNIFKLRTRYPTGFSQTAAVDRADKK